MRRLTNTIKNFLAQKEVTEFRIVNCRGAIINAEMIISDPNSTPQQVSEATAQKGAFEQLLQTFLQEYQDVNTQGEQVLKDDLIDILQTNSVDNLEDLLD